MPEREPNAGEDASVGGVPDPARPAAGPERSSSPDRVFRSAAGIAGGVLLLALVAWLGIDALIRGQGRTPWLALATMLLVVPLVSAFTVRPAVYANDERLRVRNPFRTITLPWAAVSALRSGYSNEVLDRAGAKYQLWAIPVSLRARKKAGHEQVRAAAAESGQGGGGVFGAPRPRGLTGAFGGAAGARRGRPTGPGASGPVRAPADRTMDDLRELAETRAEEPLAQGEPEVRWSYEVMAPALAGLVLLAVLLAVG
ncbi:PH domain-containing protein [Streptomyces sulfonofaciens]|uniref:PH domain-containing protein n=1 Tax=Streptomyces sulfonofaciens TaxID=68272 RepID=UPI00357163B1